MRYTRRNSGLSGTRAKLGLTKKCPPGHILRAPYRRRFSTSTKEAGYNVRRGNRTYRVYPKAGSALVQASCVKDRGLPGKGPRSGKGITMKKGELSRYGYNAHKGEEERHAALRKAIKVYGPLSVYHKLDAVAKLTKRTAPEAHRVFTTDRAWVQRHFEMKKNARY
jgi:hypothetical protein